MSSVFKPFWYIRISDSRFQLCSAAAAQCRGFVIVCYGTTAESWNLWHTLSCSVIWHRKSWPLHPARVPRISLQTQKSDWETEFKWMSTTWALLLDKSKGGPRRMKSWPKPPNTLPTTRRRWRILSTIFKNLKYWWPNWHTRRSKSSRIWSKCRKSMKKFAICNDNDLNKYQETRSICLFVRGTNSTQALLHLGRKLLGLGLLKLVDLSLRLVSKRGTTPVLLDLLATVVEVCLDRLDDLAQGATVSGIDL